MEFRPMQAEERVAVLNLLWAGFGLRDLFARYMDHDPLFRPADFLLALEDRQPIACVQIFTKSVRLRRETVTLGGIGSVATHPAFRNRGVASALLERAHAEMARREMPLALLFTGPRLNPFYERLGWVQISLRQFRLTGLGEVPPVQSRAFRPTDLERVRELYQSYTAGLSSCTLRDAAYWKGQLRYAGAPQEEFRVATDDGVVVAYARSAALYGANFALEYARGRGGAAALAALLIEAAREHGGLVAPLVPDAELGRALTQAGAEPGPSENHLGMWRVLDRPRLLELAGLHERSSDAELLAALVGGPATVYWMSDRF